MPFGQIVVLLCLSGLGYYSTLKVKLICVLFCFVFKVGVKDTPGTVGMCRNKMNGARLTCRHIGGGICCFTVL